MEKTLKERVRACEKLCGTHMAIDHPAITEILAGIGFDFVWLDTEHTSVGAESLRMHLVSAKAGGTPAFVRVPMHDCNFVKKVLDIGAAGIIFPQIETAAEADAAMKSTLYPPEGRRGFGPLGAIGYGARDLDDYIAHINEELCRFIQIESATAVRNLPEIVRNPWIDGYIFGPCDLSGSIGELNQVFGERNVQYLREAAKILKDNGKCIGVSTGSDDPEVLAFWDELGVNMISSGVDFAYMRNAAVRNLANLRRIQGR